MKRAPDPHYRHRFPAEIISHAVWLYHTFCLSFRDVELMLAERGIEVTYGTVKRLGSSALCVESWEWASGVAMSEATYSSTVSLRRESP
jgi:transposase-like protein